MDPSGNGLVSPHRSVLYHEIIHALRPTSPGRYVDATVGAGGHAWGILDASSPEGTILGLDLDPLALELARQRLSDFPGRFHLIQASYTTLIERVKQFGWETVQGIIIDLGVSSMQLDTPQRGFSFQFDGPLDMRFDPAQLISASDLVNGWDEKDLADIIWRYGEEPLSRRIAKAIVHARPLNSTRELAELISRSISRGSRSSQSKGHVHPATRTFQALRIAVNGELQSLELFLPRALSILSPGGRLAVLSFHSLEDRIVKQFFRREARDCICPTEQMVCTCDHKATLFEITRHPIKATEAEIQSNPRARSAHLRVSEKK